MVGDEQAQVTLKARTRIDERRDRGAHERSMPREHDRERELRDQAACPVLVHKTLRKHHGTVDAACPHVNTCGTRLKARIERERHLTHARTRVVLAPQAAKRPFRRLVAKSRIIAQERSQFLYLRTDSATLKLCHASLAHE